MKHHSTKSSNSHSATTDAERLGWENLVTRFLRIEEKRRFVHQDVPNHETLKSEKHRLNKKFSI